MEPETQDANANGHWIICCLPRTTTSVPTATTAALETEGDNPVMWAVGTWAASNQTPYCKELDLGTSRNCEAGTRIVLRIHREGVSAGNVRVRSIMRFFTKSL